MMFVEWFGCWMLDDVCCMLDDVCWMLDAGC